MKRLEIFIKQTFAGVVGGIMLIILGLILTPILIGIPIIFLGIGMLGAGPLAGVTGKSYSCPVCSSDILVVGKKKAVKCQSCKTRLLVKDDSLLKF